MVLLRREVAIELVAMNDKLNALIESEVGEVPVLVRGGCLWVRISAQVYNEIEDYARLAKAVAMIR